MILSIFRFLRFWVPDAYVLQMLDLLETRCYAWFAISCIAPWRYDWIHLHDRYDKSDFFSSNIISFLSCFHGISAKLSKLKFPDKYFSVHHIHIGSFWVCSRIGVQKCPPPPPSLKSVIHILQWWNLARLYLT